MSRLAVIIPTVGRNSLDGALDSLVTQMEDGDRVMVVVDDMRRYDYCSESVADARERGADGVTWRCYPNQNDTLLGSYGHAARNLMLDLLEELDERPDWVWSLDDDDAATFGAVDIIRAQIVTGDASWYVFRMRGGVNSHFPGVTVPTMGEKILVGNVGTPMMVFPVGRSRFGTQELKGHGVADMPPGYYGDWEMAMALKSEMGEPKWIPSVVCEVRP